MVNTGKASKTVILEFVGDIQKFNGFVSKEIEGIKNDAVALGEDWNDPQYKAFIDFTRELVSSLKKDIETLEYIEKNLKTKAEMF